MGSFLSPLLPGLAVLYTVLASLRWALGACRGGGQR